MSALPSPTRLEVLPGLTVDEICSVEQADEVFDQVVAAVATIEAQARQIVSGLRRRRPGMAIPRAPCLAYQKLCMPQIQARRAALVRQQKAEANASRVAASRVGAINKSRMLLQIVGRDCARRDQQGRRDCACPAS